MEKNELKEKCMAISTLIEQTNKNNVFNNVIEFFQLTSELHDRLGEIQAIPLKQKDPSVWMWLFKRKKAKKIDEELGDLGRQKLGLCQTISNCGRTKHWNNRSKEGEQITKHNIFFGGISGLNTLPIAEWEACKTTEPEVYETIANQMNDFIHSHQKGFMLTNWF